MPKVIFEKEITDLNDSLVKLCSTPDVLQKQARQVDVNIAETMQVKTDIQVMNTRLATLDEDVKPRVSLPKDSPSAKVLVQPKSPSGIPLRVLQIIVLSEEPILGLSSALAMI